MTDDQISKADRAPPHVGRPPGGWKGHRPRNLATVGYDEPDPDTGLSQKNVNRIIVAARLEQMVSP